MPLEVLINSHVQWGWSAEKLAEEYDGIPLSDIYAVLTYYYRHREEVEAYMAQSDAAAEAIRQKFVELRGPELTRTQLLQRRPFLAGESVIASGVWRCGACQREIAFTKDEKFPPCPDCEEGDWKFVSETPSSVQPR
jgi:rubrerythrin